jgi:hypothetical protein
VENGLLGIGTILVDESHAISACKSVLATFVPKSSDLKYQYYQSDIGERLAAFAVLHAKICAIACVLCNLSHAISRNELIATPGRAYELGHENHGRQIDRKHPMGTIDQKCLPVPPL